MLSIPLISIILIIIITILYFILKRPQLSVAEEESHLVVAFNDPLFIEPHELVKIITMLGSSSVDETKTYILYLHGDSHVEPLIPINKYFSMFDYKCTVLKKEELNKDSFKLFVTFTK